MPDFDQPLDLDNFLPYRLSVLANRISRGFGRLYQKKFDLTLPEWRVMAVLGRRPGISASGVVELTAMDKVAISRALARLQKMGRVVSEADREDGRRQRLFLSMAGDAIYREIIPLARRIEETLLAEIGADDRAALDRLLRVLLKAAADIDTGGDAGVPALKPI